MNCNQDQEWLLLMAEKENGCDVSVGSILGVGDEMITDPDARIEITEKGKWFYKKVQQLLSQGIALDEAFELAINEADILFGKNPNEKTNTTLH